MGGSDYYISYGKGQPGRHPLRESSQSIEIRFGNDTYSYSGLGDTLRENQNNRSRDMHTIITILTRENEFSLSHGSHTIHPVFEQRRIRDLFHHNNPVPVFCACID